MIPRADRLPPRLRHSRTLAGRFGPATKYYVKKDEARANGDCRVGNVEGRIAVGAEPHFEEVRHRAVNDPIGDIAGRAAEQQGETCGSRHAAAAAGDQQPGERGDDRDRAQNQNDARPRGGGIRQDAESDAGIATVYEINEVVD